MTYTYDYFKKSADYIRSVTDFEPEIAIILGSCLGPFAERIENPIVIPYSEIPNFLVSTVEGHAGKLIFGTIQGRKVVCMSGRFHYYEYDTLRRQIVETAQRAFAASFFRYTFLTNAPLLNII
jgi:purine-nucleoside phosphorylase